MTSHNARLLALPVFLSRHRPTIAIAMAAGIKARGWATLAPRSLPSAPYFRVFGTTQAPLDAFGHALMRLCNSKQKALGAIVYGLICFGAGFPS